MGRSRLLGAILAALPAVLLAGQSASAIEIRADARVELMAAVQRLIGNQLRRGAPTPSARAADSRLAAFSRHPAIRAAKKLSAFGFSGDLALQFSFYLTTASPLALQARPASMFEEAAGGRERLDAFVADLASLESASGFFSWFDGAENEKGRLEKGLRDAVGDAAGLEKGLTGYLGTKTWDRWVLVPSESVDDGGVAEWVLEKERGLPDVYVVVGTLQDGGFASGWQLAQSVWPEAVSSATYLLIERCGPALNRLGGLCRKEGIRLSTPEGCVQSLWTTAIVSRALEKSYGRPLPSGRSSLVDKVELALSRYELDRKTRPTILDAGIELWAPFGASAAECPLADGRRFDDALYRQRLGRELDLLLAYEDSPSLRDARCQLRAADGDLKGAEDDARAALAADPGDVESWLHLGVVLTRRGKVAEALTAFDRGGSAARGDMDPGLEADLWSSRGFAENELGRTGDAAASLRRALAVAPRDWERRADVQRMIEGLDARRPAP